LSWVAALGLGIKRLGEENGTVRMRLKSRLLNLHDEGRRLKNTKMTLCRQTQSKNHRKRPEIRKEKIVPISQAEKRELKTGRKRKGGSDLWKRPVFRKKYEHVKKERRKGKQGKQVHPTGPAGGGVLPSSVVGGGHGGTDRKGRVSKREGGSARSPT